MAALLRVGALAAALLSQHVQMGCSARTSPICPGNVQPGGRCLPAYAMGVVTGSFYQVEAPVKNIATGSSLWGPATVRHLFCFESIWECTLGSYLHA